MLKSKYQGQYNSNEFAIVLKINLVSTNKERWNGTNSSHFDKMLSYISIFVLDLR